MRKCQKLITTSSKNKLTFALTINQGGSNIGLFEKVFVKTIKSNATSSIYIFNGTTERQLSLTANVETTLNEEVLAVRIDKYQAIQVLELIYG